MPGELLKPNQFVVERIISQMITNIICIGNNSNKHVT